MWNPTYQVHIDHIERVQKSIYTVLTFKAPLVTEMSTSNDLNVSNFIQCIVGGAHDQVCLY